MKRLNDLLSGKENIKVESVNTSLITSDNQVLILRYDNTYNTLVIGDYIANMITIYGGENVTLHTEEYGEVYLNDEGFVINTLGGVTIVSGGLRLAHYTTASRPALLPEGSIIYDSTLKKCILYNGSAWVNLDGTALA